MNTKNTTTKMALLIAAVVAGGWAQQSPELWLSSYWDGCKPTCSWYQNLPDNPTYGLSKSCDVDNDELPLGDIAEAKCAKDDGTAFTCWDQIPFVDPNDPNLAYGFGATSTAVCGQCFEVTFTGEYRHDPKPMPMHSALAGKRVILMARNTGTDVNADQIDFMIPGGGLGQYDCLHKQMGVPKNWDGLGYTGGGLLSRCIDQAISTFNGNWDSTGVLEWVQDCHRQGCQSAFAEFPTLLEGCNFHIDFMESAPNPLATVRVLDTCPQMLVDGYMPQSAKYTVITKVMNFTSITGSGNKNESNKTLGGVNSGTTLTYENINVSIAGEYTVDFSIQTMENTTIMISINGQPAGTLSNVTSSSWQTFDKVTLGNKVTLNEGNNTVVLTFQTNSVNLDYFTFTGDDEVKRQALGDDTSVRQRTATRSGSAQPRATIRSISGGFTATLPQNHGYTSYKIVNLQGREIRRGNIAAGARDLRFTGFGSGMVFLRLEGAGKAPMVVRAMTR